LGFGLSIHSIQGEKIKEKVKKVDENEVFRLIKEQEDKNLEISTFKVELVTTKRTYEVQFSQMEEEAKSFKASLTWKVQEYEQQLEELRNEVKVSYFAQTTIYWYTMREKTRPRGFS